MQLKTDKEQNVKTTCHCQKVELWKLLILIYFNLKS